MSETIEKVLVIPEKVLHNYKCRFCNGIWSISDDNSNCFNKCINDIFNVENSLFMNRSEAEINPEFKQLIPYCILKAEDDTIFVYRRTKKSGEQRLHLNWSLGVGGHLNDKDNNYWS